MSLNKWLLINYAGFPYSPNSLMPDNGLASLAGMLLAGHAKVEILDYCTVSFFCQLNSRELSSELKSIWKALTEPQKGFLRSWNLRRRLGAAEQRRWRIQKSLIEEIGEQIVYKIISEGIRAVGFKLWLGDGFYGSIQLARKIRKKCPGIKIFGGGPQVDFFMADILKKYPVFDALIYGEGEETVLRLAQEGDGADSFFNIPNLLFYSHRDKRIIQTYEKMVQDLNKLPLAVYDPAVYPAMAGDEKIKIIVVDESRGCKNNCGFCIHPVKSNRVMRSKNTDRLIMEIEHLERSHGIHAFRFAGSCTPYKLLNEFAQRIIEEGKRVVYSSFAHVRESEQADFMLLKKSGCQSLFFGIESGSEKLLEHIIHKGIKKEAITRTIRDSKTAGIFTVGSFIFPLPGENITTEEETLSLIKEIRPDAVPIQFPVVTPRTAWFDKPTTYNIHIANFRKYIEELMTWKVKTLLPPELWQLLPISINGENYREILKGTSRFIKNLEALQIDTSISDDLYLMSYQAKYDVRDFRNLTREAFFTGDGEKVEALTVRINNNS